MNRVYIVLYWDGYGTHKTDECKAFNSCYDAYCYKDKLNAEIAEAEDCQIDDLGDCFIVETIPFV